MSKVVIVLQLVFGFLLVTVGANGTAGVFASDVTELDYPPWAYAVFGGALYLIGFLLLVSGCKRAPRVGRGLGLIFGLFGVLMLFASLAGLLPDQDAETKAYIPSILVLGGLYLAMGVFFFLIGRRRRGAEPPVGPPVPQYRPHAGLPGGHQAGVAEALATDRVVSATARVTDDTQRRAMLFIASIVVAYLTTILPGMPDNPVIHCGIFFGVLILGLVAVGLVSEDFAAKFVEAITKLFPGT